MIPRIEQVDHPAREDKQSVRIENLKRVRGRRAISIEAGHMRAREGVHQAVGGDFKNRLAGFISDIYVSIRICAGVMRIGKTRRNRRLPFIAGIPEIDARSIWIARRGMMKPN